MPIINENIDLDLYVMSIGFTIENKTVDVDVELYSFVFFFHFVEWIHTIFYSIIVCYWFWF